MADQPIAQPGQTGAQVPIPFDDSDLETVYVNFFRITPNTDEAILDVGLCSQVIGQTGPEPIRLTHRLVLNYITAKKLAEVLRLVLNRHEQAFGVVEVDPNRRLRSAQQQSPRPSG